MILWELCKNFKLDHKNKRYMHNPESVLKNEMHKIIWDFEIQTDHLISARRVDQVIVYKKKKKKEPVDSGLHRSVWPQCKIERKRNER